MLTVLRLATLSPILAAVLATAVTAQSAGPVYINELLASNQTGAIDEAGQNEDWIELYNASDAPISLAGYTLSDDPERPDKWPLPATATIPARGYLIVWADEDQEDGPLHANFKLARGGEAVTLVNASGNQVDAVTFPELEEDQAYARQTDGGDVFVMQAPTFAARNDGSSSLQETAAYTDFRAWPTTMDGADPVANAFLPNGVEAVLLTDALGRPLWSEGIATTSGGIERALSLPSLAPGAYYLTARGPGGSHTLALTAR